MGIEERFVDPNTQEAPLPEYNKIVSPQNNPYTYIYDDQNYFEEWGPVPLEKKSDCLLVVRGTFDGFEDASVIENPSNQTIDTLLNKTSLLIYGNHMSVAADAYNTIYNSITNYMKNIGDNEKVTFFIQPCSGTEEAVVPDKNAPFKHTYNKGEDGKIINDIAEYYGVANGEDYYYYDDVDRRIFKEIPDKDFFDHDCRVPYVEDAYRLYTRIGQAFYYNGKLQTMPYCEPNWQWSEAPSTRTIDGYSYLQIKVFDLGLYPDQCNRIYRAAYYDYQEYLPKWCTPLYSTAWKQIQTSHKEAKYKIKTKYVDATKIEQVQIGEETIWEDVWVEDSIESIDTVMAPYSSSEKAIMEFFPAEDYTGPFSITMNTGHWYGFIIKEFSYDEETGENTDSGTVIGGSGFAYRGTWTFNKNTTQITADNRSAIAMTWSDRNTYYGDWTSIWDGHNQNYVYRDTLYRYQCNKRYYDFIKQYQNNKSELNYDTVLNYFYERKQYLEDKKIQLQTDPRIGTDSNWSWVRDTFYNNKELSEIAGTYDVMLNYTQSQKDACDYDYVLNDYLSILDSSFTHEYSSYNQKLKTYSDKYGLTYTLTQHPHAVDGGVLIEPQLPEAPKNNDWHDYANHDTNKALKINSFGNVSFKSDKKYIIYTRECAGGGKEAEKFVYQSFDVNNDFNVKALTKKDKKVPKYEDQEVHYQKPVQYISQDFEEVYEYKEVEVIDYMYLQYYDEEDRKSMLREIGQRMKEISNMIEDQIGVLPFNVSEDYITFKGRSAKTSLKITRFMHDYLIQNCKYGESDFSKSFYAPFSNGKYTAESEGFALAYKFLCNAYSVPTQIVHGYIFKDPKTGEEYSEGKYHTWNRSWIGLPVQNEDQDIEGKNADIVKKIFDTKTNNFTDAELNTAEKIIEGKMTKDEAIAAGYNYNRINKIIGYLAGSPSGSTAGVDMNELAGQLKLAKDILRGDYNNKGKRNGPTTQQPKRDKAIKDSGYDYNDIQRLLLYLKKKRKNNPKTKEKAYCIIITAGNFKRCKKSWREGNFHGLACSVNGTIATITPFFIKTEFPKTMKGGFQTQKLPIWRRKGFKNFTIFVQLPKVCIPAWEPDTKAVFIKTFSLTPSGIQSCITATQKFLRKLIGI